MMASLNGSDNRANRCRICWQPQLGSPRLLIRARLGRHRAIGSHGFGKPFMSSAASLDGRGGKGAERCLSGPQNVWTLRNYLAAGGRADFCYIEQPQFPRPRQYISPPAVTGGIVENGLLHFRLIALGPVAPAWVKDPRKFTLLIMRWRKR